MLLQLTVEQTILGITLGILAFSFKNIGYVLQKSGVNQAGVVVSEGSNNNQDQAAKKILKRPIWWVGQFTTFLGAFSLILAYKYAPLSLIMPFMGVGMVVLVIFCRLYLKEQITKNEWISACVIIVGIVFSNLNLGEAQQGSDLLSFYWNSYAYPVSIIFFVCAFGSIFIAIFWSKKNNWKGASVIFGLGAGDIGGATLLFQTPFSRGLGQVGTSTEPYFMLMFIMGFVLFALGGFGAIVCLNKGYIHGEGILVAPLYAVSQMLLPIIGGIVVFEEWANASPLGIGLQTAGVVIISLGVFFLSYYNEQKRRKNLGIKQN